MQLGRLQHKTPMYSRYYGYKYSFVSSREVPMILVNRWFWFSRSSQEYCEADGKSQVVRYVLPSRFCVVLSEEECC